MRFILLCAAALLLAGCANSSDAGKAGGFASGGATSPRPKAIVVTDFVVASDVVVIDRGFTARLARKIGEFPTHERKTRTLARVNDEIVATIVANLREAGLDAQPGSEEGLSLSESAVVVSGRLRPADAAAAKKHETGIGNGRGGVMADMTLSSFSGFGRKQLHAFAAEPAGGRKAEAKTAVADNAAIAEALAAEKAEPEKLSPDVEAAARKLGRAAGEKIVAYAKTQGWLDKLGAADSGDSKPALDEAKMVKLPPVKPKTKPAV